MKEYKMNIEPLTALHIGTGEDITPWNFFVIEMKNSGKFYLRTFQPETIVGLLDAEEKKNLDRWIDNENLDDIRKLFTRKTGNHYLYQCEIDPDFGAEYKTFCIQLRESKVPNNQLIIETMYRDKRSQKPVIPGSSLKGAIRTAVIDQLAPTYGIRDKRKFEQSVLQYQNAQNDPFRTIAVGDSPVKGKNYQMVVKFERYNRKNEEFQAPTTNEVIKGRLMEGDAEGEGLLRINETLANTGSQFSKKITLPDIIKHCNSFYQGNLQDEHRKFYQSSRHYKLTEIGDILLETINKIKENQCLIRVGQFSHVECVTVSNHRDPRSNKGYGKTRSLAMRQFPAGWAILTFNEL